MNKNKVKAVKKWKIFTKIKEVKSFLEFANFYRCFIKNFSYMVKSLNKLKRKKKWKWKKKTSESIQRAKEKDYKLTGT